MRHYLRIAFSATCLIACVLLIVLWVRSYWWMGAMSWLGSVFASSDAQDRTFWLR